jgi:Mn2+/Fe2+ NRAMP family transporter
MGLITKMCRLSNSKLCFFLTAAGPGLTVMLADTDTGSLVTAAQSGAVWGYKLIALQFILIPILYMAQELTLRLGLTTGKGFGELIKIHFGKSWAAVSVITLFICCVGAMITEFSGIAGIGELLGIPRWLSVDLAVVFLIFLVFTKSYNSVERVALAIGAFELIYIFVAWKAHPAAAEIISGLQSFPIQDHNYLYLAAANIGAVIMPWMVFYQQSAIVDKGLTVKHIGASRLETLIGAIITQVIMIAIIMATAATIGKTTGGAPLTSIQQISSAITPFLGDNVGRVLFALGMLGASLIAMIVVSLAASWSVGEMIGKRHSLQNKPKEAPWFYGIFFASIMLCGTLVSSNVHLVNLNVAIEVLNAMLLPVVLGFLYVLAYKALPYEYRLRGFYAGLVGIVFIVICLFSLYAGISGFMH